MATHRQRYWKFGAKDSNDRAIVAQHRPHDPGNEVDGLIAGPPIRIEIKAADPADPQSLTHPIRVWCSRTDPMTGWTQFDHGAARWLGVRLIEAAALDEAAGYIVQDHGAELALDQLKDWITDNAVDQRLPGETTADTAIRLLTLFKEQANKGDVPGPDPREEALAFIRARAGALLRRPGTKAVREFQEATGQALRNAGINEAEMVSSLTDWLGPHKVSELRGLGAI